MKDIDEFGVRRLDMAIAKKVMEWPTDPGLPDETAFLYPIEWEDELDAWPSTVGRQQKTPDALVPRYSTNIEAAFLVVEKIRSSQDICCFTIESDYSYVWDITWVFADGITHTVHGFDFSLEKLLIAICYAALEIVKKINEKV
mgnify:CR=1 FL=1